MPDDFLDLELRLLLLKYGRNRVLQHLARLENITPEEFERRLNEFTQTSAPKKRKEPPSPEESIDRLGLSDGAQREKLLFLAREFDQGRFLPQLRDAIRFCQQFGLKTRAKSRREMLPKVMNVVAGLPPAKLDELLEHKNDGGSFARLANAIMRGT